MLLKNLRNFPNKTNLCFITGLSASGKSTLARKISQRTNSIIIELDFFERCYIFQDLEGVKNQAGEIFYNYFISHKSLYEKLKRKYLKGKILEKEIKKFLFYVIEYTSKDKAHSYIIEGVQIYGFLDFSLIKSNAIIVLPTNYLVCIFRRIKRSYKDKEVTNLKDLEFVNMLNWYLEEKEILKEFIKKGEFKYVSTRNFSYCIK